MNVTGLNWGSVNIGSGNGLVLSGSKPLPELMLTQMSIAMWPQWAKIIIKVKIIFTRLLWWAHKCFSSAWELCMKIFTRKFILSCFQQSCKTCFEQDWHVYITNILNLSLTLPGKNSEKHIVRNFYSQLTFKLWEQFLIFVIVIAINLGSVIFGIFDWWA